MNYVDSVLQPGERIIMRGRLHWIAYWHAILFLVLGIVLVAWEPAGAWDGTLRPATAIAFGMIALSCLLAPVFQVGDTRPFLAALPSQLSANWLLLVFCVLAFTGIAQAARLSRRQMAATVEASGRYSWPV